jgi:hypothetical protein
MDTLPGRRFVPTLALAACLPLALAAPLGAQEPPVFGDMCQPAPGALDARALSSGDIDADGLADVALVRSTTVMIWRATADGLSSPPVILGSTVSLRTGRLADLDDDGLADLVLLPETQPEALVAWSQGDGSFTAFESIALPTHGGAVAVADVTGDGHADLLASHFGYARLAVVPGLGDHQFGPEFDTHIVASTYRIATGDIDADGTLDLLSHNSVEVFEQDISTSHGLDGGFFAPASPLYSGAPQGFAVFIDADQDGLDDVARADNTTSIELHKGLPDGSLEPPVVLASMEGIVHLAVGDFTGDGLPDLLTGHGANLGTVELLRQTGAGLLPDPATQSFDYDGLGELLAADVDGDGLADAVSREGLTESVEALIAQQAGGFRNGYVADATQRDAVVLDADGDGRPDLLTAVSATPSGRLRSGQPNGAFGPLTSLDLGASPSHLFAGDVEPDGDVDVLVVQDLPAPGARWLVNAGSGGFMPMPTTTLPGTLRDAAADDLDGDGRLDVVLATSGPSAVVPLLSDSGASLVAQTAIAPDQAPFAMAAGDFDGAGWHDVACIAGTQVQLLQLQPAEPPISTTLDAGGSVKAVALGNFDGDGHGDLFVLILTGNHSQLTWFESDGGGAPVAVGTFDLGQATAYVRMVLGDADGDGDGELVLAGANPAFNSHCVVVGSSGAIPSIDEAHPFPVEVVSLALADADGDGVRELQAVGDLGSPVLFLPNAAPRWQRLGHSLAGGAGLSRLEGVGPLVAGEPVVLRVEGALPSAAGTLVLSPTLLNAPFKGGIMVPDADLLLSGFVTDAEGALSIAGDFPPGVPAGTLLAAQMWFADGAGPAGWSATWGIAGTSP